MQEPFVVKSAVMSACESGCCFLSEPSIAWTIITHFWNAFRAAEEKLVLVRLSRYSLVAFSSIFLTKNWLISSSGWELPPPFVLRAAAFLLAGARAPFTL